MLRLHFSKAFVKSYQLINIERFVSADLLIVLLTVITANNSTIRCSIFSALHSVFVVKDPFRDSPSQTPLGHAATFCQTALGRVLFTCQQENGVQWTQISINISASQCTSIPHSVPLRLAVESENG